MPAPSIYHPYRLCACGLIPADAPGLHRPGGSFDPDSVIVTPEEIERVSRKASERRWPRPLPQVVYNIALGKHIGCRK